MGTHRPDSVAESGDLATGKGHVPESDELATGTGHAPADLAVVALPSAPDAPARARRHLERVGLTWPSDVLEPALLLTSELVTNAVRHGSGRIGLAIRGTSPLLRIEVSDADPGPVPPPAAAPVGRGLRLLDALATRWGCRRRPDAPGKVVWFELERPDRRSGAGASPPVPDNLEQDR